MNEVKRAELQRRSHLYRLASDFVYMVIVSDMAHFIPSEVIDKIPEGEEREFMDILRKRRLVQRPDRRWEEKR